MTAAVIALAATLAGSLGVVAFLGVALLRAVRDRVTADEDRVATLRDLDARAAELDLTRAELARVDEQRRDAIADKIRVATELANLRALHDALHSERVKLLPDKELAGVANLRGVELEADRGPVVGRVTARGPK